MDFSNYRLDHANYNKDKHLIPGYFKDEYGMFLSSYYNFIFNLN